MEGTSSKNLIEDCRLNLPDGLRELMGDISREVLRAQPSNLYRFIADYLSALLVTRDHLSIADQVCDYVCQCDCQPELLIELEQLGLDEHNAQKVKDIVLKNLQKEEVNERTILAALLAKTNIEADMYPDVVNAVRLAYIRHQSHNIPKYEASYRAYGVRREIASKKEQEIPIRTYMSYAEPGHIAPTSNNSSLSERMQQQIELTASLNLARIKTDSSMSLAGSFCDLPRHKPYNTRESENLYLLEETEKEHSHIDYTARSPHTSLVSEEGKKYPHSDKRISFQDTSEGELYYEGVTAYDETTSINIALIDDAIPQEQESDQNKADFDEECNDESVATEFSDETVSEEIIENVDYEIEKTGVNKTDRDYIKAMNSEVDTDSCEDLEAQ
ncbi:unnamed protein product [Arctia plantaginis]|uniref:RIIa domain-containing protein n=1 Tax=Arctia plantaginis TaxID=874455 RepID=A0A8S1AGG6_ARCPL|nr:unnamed protein product [Arctia plantaginis]CAB3260484.1 unnamed protein product [Arctia plantaginis]